MNAVRNGARLATIAALLVMLALLALFLARQRGKFFSFLDAGERHQRAVAENNRALSYAGQGDYVTAAAILEQAARDYPGEPAISQNLAFTYGDLCCRALARSQLGEARQYSDRALALCDSSAVLWYIRADLCDRLHLPDSATAAAAAAQRLGGMTPAVRARLERLQRDLAAQSGFQSSYSGHFDIRFDGAANSALAAEVLAMLEAVRDQVGSDLGWQVSGTTDVILYSGRQFADVTRLPSWTGAAFDGTIRVPVAGCCQDRTMLRAVLAHEFTHAALYDMTGNRCPSWFAEGLAQREEGRAAEAIAVPLAPLAGPFTALRDDQARQAYAASLSAVAYLTGQRDMSLLRILLEKMRGGQEFAAAFAATYGQTLDEFERQWQQSVAH